jgi:hypothetical protein
MGYTEAMEKIHSLFVIPLGIALAVSPSLALAATPEELAGALLEETAEVLGVQVDDPVLVDLLESDLEFAIEEEVIDPNLLNELDQAIDAGEEPAVEDALEENLLDQEESWRDKAPELLTAFEMVKLEFQQCREQTDGPANECARGLGLKLQVASMEMALGDVEALRLSLDTLTGEERVQAEVELDEA